MSLPECVCVLTTFAYICTVVCLCVCARPWCPYAVTSPSTRQQPRPLHSSILHCHLKKPITSSPSDSHRPLVHIKRPIYTDPLSLKLFFKGKILFCALLVSKARQHSRESTTYIKVSQEQKDTSKGVRTKKNKKTHTHTKITAWTTSECLDGLIFVYWIWILSLCVRRHPGCLLIGSDMFLILD